MRCISLTTALFFVVRSGITGCSRSEEFPLQGRMDGSDRTTLIERLWWIPDVESLANSMHGTLPCNQPRRPVSGRAPVLKKVDFNRDSEENGVRVFEPFAEPGEPEVSSSWFTPSRKLFGPAN